jgi:hypothetical protein
MSVRITAAGAVAFVLLAFLTAPVSACDERYIKKCERASAAAAGAAEAQATAPVAKRRFARRVQVVASRRSRHTRFTKRTGAPGFTIKREAGMRLASASSRMTTLVPESALARRFRGFIDPQPLAQNAFEALRKPHLVAVNLEPPIASPPAEPVAMAEASASAASAAPAVSVITTAKQDRIAPKPAAIELASAQSKPVTLAELAPPAKSFAFATANAAPAPAVPQTFLSETPPSGPVDPQPGRFSIHQLMLALCGALGAASALRFIVGA